ncbi:MAG: hypothetical protein AB3N22_13335 [Ruegeria sp.]
MHGVKTRHPRRSAAPEVFYGYSYQTGGMRMMNIDDYLCNIREGYAQIQDYTDRLYGVPHRKQHARGRYHPHDCGCDYDCDCHHDHCCGYDSCCDCCICDADVVIEARCLERRLISLTFCNDTRRDREVTLSLSGFTTASGRDLNWTASLSETKFKLGPCGEKTVQLAVQVDCAAFCNGKPDSPDDTGQNQDRATDVDHCEVAYARVSADGCISRPVLVAVAVLPNHCDSYVSGCKCGCC